MNVGQITGKLSPFLERTRNNQVAQIVRDGSTLLDLGCGRAALYHALLRKKKTRVNYFGVDRIQACIDSNKSAFPGCTFFCADVDSLRSDMFTVSFDVVALVAVLEHINNPERVFSKINKLLPVGGKIVITTPRRRTEGLLSLGARLGWCSSEAMEEHQDEMPDKSSLQKLASQTGFGLAEHRYFLFGLVQLAIFDKQCCCD